MRQIPAPILLLAAALALAACDVRLLRGRPDTPPPIQSAAPCDPAAGPCPEVLAPDADTLRPRHRPGTAMTAGGPGFVEGRQADALDTSSAGEKAAALATGDAAAERELGRTVATLGDVAQQGFWLKTPLVATETEGRVVWADNGNAVKVTLMPRPGSGGSQISLAAMRALGVPLTALAELIVFAQ
jgi:hypothetical protein